MKRYISSLFLLLLSLSSIASTEKRDTLLIVDKPSTVVITENTHGTLITVTDTMTGTEQSHFVSYAPGAKVSTSQHSSKTTLDIPGFNYMSRKNQNTGWAIGIDGLCIGLNKATDQTGGGGLQWSKSFEISWLSCINGLCLQPVENIPWLRLRLA